MGPARDHALVCMTLLTLLMVLPAVSKEAEATMQQPARILGIGFDDFDWSYASQGKFKLIRDPRGLHPWDVSADGDFAALTTKVSIPGDWQGPIYLNLYANDTYVVEGWEQARQHWTHSVASWQVFIGHRFKQVLIDDEVVWEQDVGDAESFDYFSLDISPWVQPGHTFTLTLRVLDKVGSVTKLPGDEFHLGIWSWAGLADPEAEHKFYTRVFWGDVAISAGAPLPWEQNPERCEVKLNPVSLAAAEPPVSESARLTLSAPDGLPQGGYPVTWGLPFGRGQLFDATNIALTDRAGRPVPLQAEVLQRWPDGSIRWLLLDFHATAEQANQPLTIRWGTQVQAPTSPNGVQVIEDEGRVEVNTGALRFAVVQGARELACDFTPPGADAPLGKRLVAEVVTRDGWTRTQFVPVNEQVNVEAAGPERATIAITGHLVAGEEQFGRFTCRIYAYRDQPFVRVLYRIFNDTDYPATLVEQMVLRLETPLVDGEARLGEVTRPVGADEVDRLLVRQYKADAYEIFEGNDARRARGEVWKGPVVLQGDAGTVAGGVRHFAQLYPKRMWAGYGGQLTFDLFARTNEYEQYVMTRGEAKRHELLLYFSAADAEQIARTDLDALFAAFESPPALLSPQWYADQQAFGRGAPLTPEAFPNLYHWMVERDTPSLAVTVPLGLRNWPDAYSDSVYSAFRGTWGNNYQDPIYGALVVGLLSGTRPFLDYATAYAEHFVDVDICHHHSDPRMVGASYGTCPYHTGGAPYALNPPNNGLFHLYYLTGDRDLWDAAVGIADWVHAAGVGKNAFTARQVGWPLRALAIAYEHTADPKFLDAARSLAENAMGDLLPRRYVFTNPGTVWQYRGGTGMSAQFAAGMMRYWQVSGDERAARIAANAAYQFAYDNLAPEKPGFIVGYDPTQTHYIAHLQYVMTLFMGYELTSDETLLRAGGQMLEQGILASDKPGAHFCLANYWEVQHILYGYALYRQMASSGK